MALVAPGVVCAAEWCHRTQVQAYIPWMPHLSGASQDLNCEVMF